MVTSALFLLAALSSSFTLVRAVAPFPIVPDVLVAGKTVQIGWNAATDQGWKSMKVELMTGSNFNMVSLMTLGTNEDGSVDGSVTLSVPCVQPYGKFYFTRFTSTDSTVPPNYSTRSIIQSSTGEVDPAPNQNEPDGQNIPWANGTIVSCSSSSASSTNQASSTTPASTKTPTSSTTPASSVTDPGTAPASTSTASASSSSSTSSSGGKTSVVLSPPTGSCTTQTATATAAPTGGATATVTETTTVTVTRWHRPDTATKFTTIYSTITSSQSRASATPTSNDDNPTPLFTFTPQTNAVNSKKSGAVSMRHDMEVWSILAGFIGIGAVLY